MIGCLVIASAFGVFELQAQEATQDPPQEGAPANVAPPNQTPSEESSAPESPDSSEETPSSNSTLTPPPTPTPEPKPLPPVMEVIDSLSDADLQDAIGQLKANYIRPEAFSDQELNKALLLGIMNRLGTGAILYPNEEYQLFSQTHPFYGEILDERIAYLRLGTLEASTLDQLDASLEKFAGREIGFLVLDLRASGVIGGSANFDLARDVIKRFVPKGKLLFSVKKPGEKQERIFTSDQDPKFTGVVLVLIDQDTRGAGEVIAAVIRASNKSLLVGDRTAGRAVETTTVSLKGGQKLEFAVAEVIVPEIGNLFPNGVTPDLRVEFPQERKLLVFKESQKKGLGQFVFDKKVPRMNEAALTSGDYVEIEEFQEEMAQGKNALSKLRDPVLQRAVDLMTTISIYESKPIPSASEGL